MSSVLNAFLFFSIFFLLFSKAHAQVPDTLFSEEEILDTVRIKKDPVVIKRTVIVEGALPERKTEHGIDFYFSGGIYNNYYATCEVCKPYTDKVKSGSTPLLSYGAGLGYAIYKKWWSLYAGFSFSRYRERFSYSDTTVTSAPHVNCLDYIGLAIGAGIRILSTDRISVFFVPEAGIVKRIGASGEILKTETEVRPLNASGMYRDFNYSAVAGIRLNYKLNDYLRLWTEPYFQGDLSSVTSFSHFYLQQKVVYGARFGAFYVLN